MSDYLRFDPPLVVYEGAGWPLGVRPGRDSGEQVAMSGMSDGYFDYDVRCALTLPRRYAGLDFRPPPRREMANFRIRHVGRWDGEPSRFAEIVTGLARFPERRVPGYKYHAAYALTPFSIIGQTWCERDASQPAYIVDTQIAFFYTFETLIQECYIADAKRTDASTADILAAYEHRYANTRSQPNWLLRDPTKLKLARYANPSIDWDNIRALPENRIIGGGTQGRQARNQRQFLFLSRLQTHLMVAIAVACQGLGNFASGRVRSALARTMNVPPDADALSPHWLGHMIGSYDHAAECADLLLGLARYYEQDLSSEQLRGIPIPPFRSPGSEPDLWSVPSGRPYLDGCTTGDAYDAYRWNLFDPSLDDESVIRWGREAFEWVERSDGKVPPGIKRHSSS
ncbi:hypothetical protein JQ628_13470 [Bradyrhizobium lablabi]|uniref:hypothetical protein n=1 Tax=Bradyrhizobium lablabi TaxID=722472 RepID=UPI001BA53E6D|nr:hypothetical protein [Bradyrhizobium lablabi]MBR1122530.1 hypothetical protein [Bradyrhizobium lablabi]